MTRPFTRRERSAWGGFLSAYSLLYRSVEVNLKANASISHVEYEVLLRLELAPDRRMLIQGLTDAAILSQSGMSRVIDRLERAGLVAKEQAVEDRRNAHVRLTAAGRDRFEEALAAHVPHVRSIFLSRFSGEELDQLAEFWSRILMGPQAASDESKPNHDA